MAIEQQERKRKEQEKADEAKEKAGEAATPTNDWSVTSIISSTPSRYAYSARCLGLSIFVSLIKKE